MEDHERFAGLLRCLAKKTEENYIQDDQNKKPWLSYKKAASSIQKCKTSLKSVEDLKALKSVGDVIADLYMEFKKTGEISLLKP